MYLSIILLGKSRESISEVAGKLKPLEFGSKLYQTLTLRDIMLNSSKAMMSHDQSHHLTPLRGRLPLKREISTHWQAGYCLFYPWQAHFFNLGGPLPARGVALLIRAWHWRLDWWCLHHMCKACHIYNFAEFWWLRAPLANCYQEPAVHWNSPGNVTARSSSTSSLSSSK